MGNTNPKFLVGAAAFTFFLGFLGADEAQAQSIITGLNVNIGECETKGPACLPELSLTDVASQSDANAKILVDLRKRVGYLSGLSRRTKDIENRLYSLELAIKELERRKSCYDLPVEALVPCLKAKAESEITIQGERVWTGALSGNRQVEFTVVRGSTPDSPGYYAEGKISPNGGFPDRGAQPHPLAYTEEVSAAQQSQFSWGEFIGVTAGGALVGCGVFGMIHPAEDSTNGDFDRGWCAYGGMAVGGTMAIVDLLLQRPSDPPSHTHAGLVPTSDGFAFGLGGVF